MSYKGYAQHICQNGHRFDTADPTWSEVGRCPICNALPAFTNEVDDTNCDAVGVIVDWKPFQLTEEVVEKCSLGHNHVTTHATYRIPTPEEKAKAQHYWDGNKHIPLPPLWS